MSTELKFEAWMTAVCSALSVASCAKAPTPTEFVLVSINLCLFAFVVGRAFEAGKR